MSNRFKKHIEWIEEKYKGERVSDELKTANTKILLHYLTNDCSSLKKRKLFLKLLKHENKLFDQELIKAFEVEKGEGYIGGLQKKLAWYNIDNLISRTFNMGSQLTVYVTTTISKGNLRYLIPVVISLIFILLLFQCQDVGFMYFKDKQYYISSQKPDEGFIGKTNAIFESRLNEVEGYLTTFDQLSDTLDNPYRDFFTFYIPPDGTLNDIRLIDINDNKLSEKEKQFYFRSDFITYLNKQQKDYSKQYFKIGFSQVDNGFKINSIEVNPELARVPLTNETSWKGSIYAKKNYLLRDAVGFSDESGNIYPILNSSILSNNERNENITQDFFITSDLYKNILFGRAGYSYPFGDETYLNLSKFGDSLFFSVGEGNSIRDLDDINSTGASQRVINLDKNYRFILNEDKLIQIDTANTFNLLRFTKHNIKGLSVNYGNDSFIDTFGKQIGMQLPNSLPFSEKNVQLSIDNYLSKYLEYEMINFLEDAIPGFIQEGLNLEDTSLQGLKSQGVVIKMGVTVMNPSTGEVLAAPYFNSIYGENTSDSDLSNSRNENLINHNIGSAFKPLLVLNNCLLFPELTNFQLDYGTPNTSRASEFESGIDSDEILRLLGYPIPSFFGDDDNRGNERDGVTLNEAFLNSSNTYPLAQLFLALSNPDIDENSFASRTFSRVTDGNFEAIDLLEGTTPHANIFDINGSSLQIGNFESTDVVANFKNLFDISTGRLGFNSGVLDPKLLYDYSVWSNFDPQQLHLISPDSVSLRTDFIGSGYTQVPVRTHLVPWVLGAGDNKWNNIKLAEAYSRIVSKRGVRATFLQNQKAQPKNILEEVIEFKARKSIDYRLGLDNHNEAWNQILDALDTATTKYYLRNKLNLDDNLDNISRKIDGLGSLVGLGKTGSPSEYVFTAKDQISFAFRKKIRTDGIFAFSIMTREQYNSVRENEEIENNLGLVIIVSVALEQNKRDGKKEGTTLKIDFGSTIPKRFLSQEILENIILFSKPLFQ